MKCPYCNQEHASGTRICPVTGKVIPEEPASHSSETIIQTPDQIFNKPDFSSSRPSTPTVIGQSPVDANATLAQQDRKAAPPPPAQTVYAPPAQPAPQAAAVPRSKPSSCMTGAIILALVGACGLVIVLGFAAFVVFGLHGKLPFNIPGLPLAAKASPTTALANETETLAAASETSIPGTVTITSTIASATATFTPSPSLSPTPAITLTPTSSCPGAVPQQVAVGMRAQVCTKSDNLIVRSDANLSADELFRMATGTQFNVIGGPTCANSSSWWLIKTDAGRTGWVREGQDAVDKYYICPVK